MVSCCPLTPDPRGFTQTFLRVSSVEVSDCLMQTLCQLRRAASMHSEGTAASAKLTKMALWWRRTRFRPMKFSLVMGNWL